MTPEELLEAKKFAIQLKTTLEAFDPSDDSLFAGVGPSQSFLNTQLQAAGVTPEQLQAVVGKIDEAVNNDDIDTINTILGIGKTLLSTVKSVLAF